MLDVCRKQRARRAAAESPERALGLQVLEDRFDDDVGPNDAVTLVIGHQAVERRARQPRFPETLLEQRTCAIDRWRNVLGLTVLQRDVQSLECTPRGDVAAHGAGADHVHVLQRPRGLAAEALQPILEHEHAHEIA
jgi:hypothetical protein